MLSAIIFILSDTLMNSQVLILAGLGGLLSEKSGVINIGLEGIMTIGAFAGASVAYFTENPWFALFSGGFAGIILALLHAIFTICLYSNQIITGVAINFLGPAVSMLMGAFIFGNISTPPINSKLPILFDGVLNKDSVIFQIFGKRYSVYLAILGVFILHIFFNYTKIGLRVKASGEYPEVLDSLGVSVNKIRFFCVLASGFLAGISGSVVTTVITSTYMQGIVGGQGFIALVMLIFGRWTPIGIFIGSLLFAFIRALVVFLTQTSLFTSFVVFSRFFIILPYVAIILGLLFFSKKNCSPKSLGLPFKKN